MKRNRRIEFIGDSLTCAFGNEGEPPCHFSADTEYNFIIIINLISFNFQFFFIFYSFFFEINKKYSFIICNTNCNNIEK